MALPTRLWVWVAAAGTRRWLSEHAQVRKPVPGHILRFGLVFFFFVFFCFLLAVCKS